MRLPPITGLCLQKGTNMQSTAKTAILAINTGSSSLKARLYNFGSPDSPPDLLITFKVEQVGQPASLIKLTEQNGSSQEFPANHLADHGAAIGWLFDWLGDKPSYGPLSAIGHRLVFGGLHYSEPQLIDPPMLADLHKLVPLDPDHLPQALQVVEATGQFYPALPQIACFDTAFYNSMPAVARRYALPRALWEEGLRRYGFHGLSYQYIVDKLRADAGEAVAASRLIIAHLGSGASLAAVQGGKSLDTTMGFTPTGGLVMSSRSGDLDPGVMLYLLTQKGLTTEELNQLVNRQSGLLGVSGSSADMNELLKKEASDPQAAEAIELFCYQARKFTGGFVSVLGGLDNLIFTAGIGENAASIRLRICQGLAFLGVEIETELNQANAPIISSQASAVTVRVLKTDEEVMIARHTYRVLSSDKTGQTN